MNKVSVRSVRIWHTREEAEAHVEEFKMLAMKPTDMMTPIHVTNVRIVEYELQPRRS